MMPLRDEIFGGEATASINGTRVVDRSASEQDHADVDFSNVTRETLTPATGAAPDNPGAPRLASEQQEEAVREFGAQVQGVLAPTLTALDALELKIAYLKTVIAERQRLLVDAALDNERFAVAACEHTAIIGSAVEKLASEIEASVPVLPAAMARAA
jgi:hypothetical protein